LSKLKSAAQLAFFGILEPSSFNDKPGRHSMLTPASITAIMSLVFSQVSLASAWVTYLELYMIFVLQYIELVNLFAAPT
jgi:hypothetical protein